MNRVRDYSGFAIGYCGFGYILLWPLSSPDAGGELFGAALICGDGAFASLTWLCHLPHPLQLSMPLHLLGFFCALLVATRLTLCAFRRVRRQPAVAAMDASAPAARLPGIIPRPSRRKLLGPPRPVKPRAHFGLRGDPH